MVDQPGVQAIAARLGIAPMHVGLAWLLRHAPNILLIPGTKSIVHLEQNLAASLAALDEEAMAALDALGASTLGGQPPR